MTQLARDIIRGKVRAIARGISLVENNTAGREELIDALFPHTGRAQIWGITGPPGAGKSTLADLLISSERKKGRRVAVVAVDPSSPFTGGALLGDRLRMQSHAEDEGVFIRSMASRGYLGGVSRATLDAIKVLDAAGFDTIIVETIGVGQTEVDIIELTDIVLLVLVPGMGDEIQAMKAGVMEIGDIFVINKSDKEGAEKLRTEVEYVLGFKYTGEREKMNSVCLVSAKMNKGIEHLAGELEERFRHLEEGGALREKRKERIRKELLRIFSLKIHEILDRKMDFYNNVGEWAELIYNKDVKPYHFINERLRVFLKKESE